MPHAKALFIMVGGTVILTIDPLQRMSIDYVRVNNSSQGDSLTWDVSRAMLADADMVDKLHKVMIAYRLRR